VNRTAEIIPEFSTHRVCTVMIVHKTGAAYGVAHAFKDHLGDEGDARLDKHIV
jgi:hypothetical protein